VAEGITGSDGIAPFLATQNIYYKILVTHPTYNTAPITYLMSTVNPIDIQLATTGTTLAPESPVNTFLPSNLTTLWTPTARTQPIKITINVSIMDSASLLNYALMNVTYWNYTGNFTQYYYNNATGSNSYTFPVTLTNKGIYKFELRYLRNFTNYYESFTYTAANYTNWFNAKEVEDSGGLSVMFFKIIAFFTILAVTAMLYPFMGILVALMLPIMFGVTVIMNIFTLGEYAIIVIVSIISIMAVARSGQ